MRDRSGKFAQNLKLRLRQAARWVLSFHGSPTQVARGMAIGVFVGFSPPLGLQMVTAAVLATLTYSNRAAAIAAVWITNPLTALPLYLMTYRVGRVFTPNLRPVDVRSRLKAVVIDENGEWLNVAQQMRELFSLGADVLIPMTIGGLIVGTVAGVLAYVLTRLVIHILHRR